MTEPVMGDLVAAVDLGSNSFHMVIARQTGHDLQMLDRLREPVRLSAGVRKDGGLSERAQERALGCLDRFGQRLRELPAERVRAVGTNAFRQARRAAGFRSAAERALGHRIEVISGMEEARLIYLGVAHTTPAVDEERLVVDIGGGSTEIMRGHGFELNWAASRFMGSVTFTREFFSDGPVTREQFRAAQTAASRQIQDLAPRFRDVTIERVLGASGTVLAVGALLRHLDLTDGTIDYVAMRALRRMIIEDPGGPWYVPEVVREDRLRVLPGGLSILMALHRTLGLEEIQTSQGALREGLLYDQVGRVTREEVMERTVDRMVERFAADPDQAAQVERSALELLDQLGPEWELDPAASARMLHWASRLHESGLSLAHTGYHRLGAFLIAHADMPGFSVDEQAIASALIRACRRKIRFEYFEQLPSHFFEKTLLLAVIFRIAVLLNRSRSGAPHTQASLTANRRKIRLSFEEGWLDEHALTAADLTEEAEQLRAIDLRLSFGPTA
jgi:exopolyphosphatase/guanosine-5'-triphosphate,3'-diphosphate pyrophosphatase